MIATLILLIIILLWFTFLKVTCGRTKTPVCLLGKTAIITGGNAGIGFQVCLNLASRGCRVIIADKDDSEKSRKSIIEQSGNHNIVSKHLDLASFKSIRKFVCDILATESRLDILINNAGVGALPPYYTEDGFHPTVQVNYFGPFLLTHLLIDLLKKSSPSRIVFTASQAAMFGIISRSTLLPELNNYESSGFNHLINTIRTYCNTKLATMVSTATFAEKLNGTNVVVNSLNPGWVRTGIFAKLKTIGGGGNYRLFVLLLEFIGFIIGKDVWEGSQTTTHLAIAEELGTISGKYFLDCRQFPTPPQAWNRKSAEELWKISEKCVGLTEKEKI